MRLVFHAVPDIAGTALLVDDEELIRNSTADMFAEPGYAVAEANSGEEVLRLSEGGRAFDVLVTDYLMPGLSGTELARAVQERYPGGPVLVLPGYADVEGFAPALPRLVKAFKPIDLAAKLREMRSAANSRQLVDCIPLVPPWL